MRWLSPVPLLIGALASLPACDETGVAIDEREPIDQRDELGSLDPDLLGPDVVLVPALSPEELIDFPLDDLRGPMVVLHPKIEDLDDLDGDGFPDAVLVIDWEGLDPIDICDLEDL